MFTKYTGWISYAWRGVGKFVACKKFIIDLFWY